MFNSLLATLVICLGLGVKSNPVSNYEKETPKETIVQPKSANPINYSLVANTTPLQETNYYGRMYLGVGDNVGTGINQAIFKGNLSATNSYASINGNILAQVGWQTDENNQRVHANQYSANYTTYQNNWANYDTWYKNNFNPYAYIIYVLQVNLYGIQQSTSATINIGTDVQSIISRLENAPSAEARSHIHQEIYVSNDTSWSQYINQQIRQNHCSRLVEEITDVNTNYMYNKIENDYVYENGNQNITITNEIQVDTTRSNYIIIVNKQATEYIGNAYNDYNGWYGFSNLQLIKGSTVIIKDQNTIVISGTRITDATNYEVIDLPGLMFQILTMPFTFISTAFNLTLFPGTPYQVNIANLFLAIVALFVFIFLLSILLKGLNSGK